MSKRRVLFILLSVIALSALACRGHAWDTPRVTELTQAIAGAESAAAAYADFEELTELYFGQRRYDEYADLLKNLSQKKKEFERAIDYYTALDRYYQLSYLEESQSWDEYFGRGNEYRGSIKDCLEKVIGSRPAAADIYGLQARLLLWKFQKGQDAASGNAALDGLMDYISVYALSAGASLSAIKEAAHELRSYDEEVKARQAYRIYTEKLIASGISTEELKDIAMGFYKEGDLELAENIYDAYIERSGRTLPKEEMLPLLVNIARLFSYGRHKLYDTAYAENLFVKIEEAGGAKTFDEDLMYLRALNLEKAKQYKGAAAAYQDFCVLFPGSGHADEAAFKSGLILAYGLGNREEARVVFKRPAERANPYAAASLYQLGLLSQWQNDLESAKKYYTEALSVGAGFKPAPTMAKIEQSDIAAAAQERLVEIAGQLPIEYNLKVFLDAVFGPGRGLVLESGINLETDPRGANKNELILISSSARPLESGCIPMGLEYFWSGQLGNAPPQNNVSTFSTSYAYPGCKQINLVVALPAGIIGYDFTIIDVE